MLPTTHQKIRVIDSHTGGEPTRVLVGDTIVPSGTSMEEKRESFRRDFDWVRTACVCEPRGHEAMVGALLCEPVNEGSVAGVIFFNNVDVLHGCLHGTMGVAVTLLHMGRIEWGTHQLDTPTGTVTITITPGGNVEVTNVRSYRYRSDVSFEVAEYGTVTGDIAWGGNWFFLTESTHSLKVESSQIPELTELAWRIRTTLAEEGITGAEGAEIDHIELFGPPSDPESADNRNFVLCPGKAFDRSPCGTGTSAKLACLYDSGKLTPGTTWRQAGILDTVFEGQVDPALEGGVHPTVRGSAFITAEADLLIDPSAPFAFGIRSLLS